MGRLGPAALGLAESGAWPRLQDKTGTSGRLGKAPPAGSARHAPATSNAPSAQGTPHHTPRLTADGGGQDDRNKRRKADENGEPILPAQTWVRAWRILEQLNLVHAAIFVKYLHPTAIALKAYGVEEDQITCIHLFTLLYFNLNAFSLFCTVF